MHKIFLTLLILTSLGVQSKESRIYKKLNYSEAQVTIKTDEKESVQAGVYADGIENSQFIDDMLMDKNSILSKLKSSIENENCGKVSPAGQLSVEGCGHVTLTKEVRTSFGRGGWMSAGGTYTFFVGFTNDGTGQYFDVSHMVVISESTDAQRKSDGTYSGVILKNLTLVKIKRIDENTP